MEQWLSNLKNSMDKTVLKKGKMSPNDKKRIFEAAIMKAETKKRNRLAPILSYVVIPAVLLLIGFYLIHLYQSGDYAGEEITPEKANSNPSTSIIDRTEQKDREKDILSNAEYSHVVEFLYSQLRIVDIFSLKEDAIDVIKSDVYTTEIYAKHFAALEENPEIIDNLDKLALAANNFQNESKREDQEKWIKELDQILKKLINLADPNGEHIHYKHYYYDSPELANLETWLTFVKESIEKEQYSFYEQNFEVFLAAAINVYTSYFIPQYNNPDVWEKIDEIAEIAKNIIKEENRDIRLNQLRTIEVMVDELLVMINEPPKGEVATEITWVESDKVIVNELKCNDVTGLPIPDHLIEICKIYDELPPLTEEEKDLFSNETATLTARSAFHNDYKIGENGFGESFKDYGEYLLFDYLSWRLEFQPNAKAEVKGLRHVADFEDFYKLEDNNVITLYGYGEMGTFREVLEYELQVVSRMENLNLPNVFIQWSDETAEYYEDAIKLYDEGKVKEAYLSYVEGLKRMHDLYFSIPMHSIIY